MHVSPIHDRGITIRIDDEEVLQKETQQKEEFQRGVLKGVQEETEEDTEEETEEETEETDEDTEEDTEEETEGSDEETFGFRPQKKPVPVSVTQPKAPVAQPKKTFYWIAPFDE